MAAKNKTLSHVTINLLEIPVSGSTGTMLLRTRPADHEDIKKAAQILGMRLSDFLRTCVIQAARKVNAELGG